MATHAALSYTSCSVHLFILNLLKILLLEFRELCLHNQRWQIALQSPVMSYKGSANCCHIMWYLTEIPGFRYVV